MDLKAAQHQCLPYNVREAFIERLGTHIVDFGDVSFLLDDTGFEALINQAERAAFMDVARSDLRNRFESLIDSESSNYDASWDPTDWFDELNGLIADHRDLFPDDKEVDALVDEAQYRIKSAIESIEENREPEPDWDRERRPLGGMATIARGRSIFDDLI